MATQAELVAAATEWLARGGRAIPTIGKRPTQKWGELKRLPQDEEVVRRLFSNGATDIAQLTYPWSPFVVFDFDVAPGGSADHSLKALRSIGIELPDTARTLTPSGGVHYIYRMPKDVAVPGDIKRKVRLIKAKCGCLGEKSCGVDFLVKGYFVIPPSDGYKEDPEFPIENITTLPETVLQQVIDLIGKASSNGAGSRSDSEEGRIKDGERSVRLTSMAGSMRRRGMTFESILAALREENQRRCDPPLNPKEVEKIAESVAGYEPAVEIQNLTDLGNAKRFAAMHAGYVLYSAQRNKWILWTGQRWQCDETGAVFDLAEAVIREMYSEASRQQERETREAVSTHAAKSESRGKIEAMLALAQSLPEIRTDVSRFDRNQFLFNASNATIDLKTGAAREFDRQDFITKICPTVYNPDAECPLFMEFLDIVTQKRKDLAEFLQRAAGYALTGDTGEQCIFILTGDGGNGKTTFLDTLVRVIGIEYAQQLKTEILFENRYEGTNDYHVAELAGIRLAAAVESKPRRTLNMSFIKQATGGEMLIGRRPYELPIRFFPEFKLFFGTNHPPRIDDATESAWRRLHIIPFDHRFEEDTRITSYEDKLVEEASGILNWMITGTMEWRRIGLKPPDTIKSKTKEYRAEEDMIGRFLSEKCVVDPKDIPEASWVSVGVLYQAYAQWCKDGGEQAENATAFGIALNRKGFDPARYRTKAGRVRYGLRLMDPGEETERE